MFTERQVKPNVIRLVSSGAGTKCLAPQGCSGDAEVGDGEGKLWNRGNHSDCWSLNMYGSIEQGDKLLAVIKSVHSLW
jgi:hypothetical protein